MKRSIADPFGIDEIRFKKKLIRYFRTNPLIAWCAYGRAAFSRNHRAKVVFLVDSTEVGGASGISAYYEDASGELMSARRQLSGNLVKYELRDCRSRPEAIFVANLYLQHHWRWCFPRPSFSLFHPPPPPIEPPPLRNIKSFPVGENNSYR